jgi:hypothetical protein
MRYVLTAMTIKFMVFWHVTLCHSVARFLKNILTYQPNHMAYHPRRQ